MAIPFLDPSCKLGKIEQILVCCLADRFPRIVHFLADLRSFDVCDVPHLSDDLKELRGVCELNVTVLTVELQGVDGRFVECGVRKLNIGFLDEHRMNHFVLEFVGHLQWLAQFHGVHFLNVLDARLSYLGPQEERTVEGSLYEEVIVDVLEVVDTFEEQEERLLDV